jgi:hypothetical protein
MATTTNYSWVTPDDTSLVKDGASAIRTLGSSVDTTVKALNPETTLGDIAYRSSTANVKTRLALGTANQVLAVNSGATAPEWKTLASGGMTLLSTTALTGASVTVSSIDQTYRDLQIVIINGYASGANNTFIRYNGDTGNNYAVRNIAPGVTSANLDYQTAANVIYFGEFKTSDGYLNGGYIYATIPRYSQTEYKSTIFTASAAGGLYIGQSGWNNTAAITSITMGVTNSQTMSGGTMYIYGAK